MPLLSREREVIALDLPGFGAAPSLPAGVEPTALALAEALRDQLDALGTPRPHVAGNSLGAWVGLELGRIGAARSVTCLSPAGLWRGPIGPSKSRTREWARRLRPLVGLGLRVPPLRRRALTTFSAHPDRVPAAAGPQAGRSTGSTPTATRAPTRRCGSTSSTRPATRRRARSR